MARTYQFLEPGPGAAIPVVGTFENPGRDLDPQLAERRVETSAVFPMCVYSVPAGDGARDFFVACGCGWFSLPLVENPTVLRCEACDARRQGAENFSRWFAPAAAQRGCHVERQVELKGAA